jgi:hypothetical protein
LEACYRELLEGRNHEELATKYVRIEVLAAQGLYQRGITQEELRRFHERQAARIQVAATHTPYGECAGRDEQFQEPVGLNADGSKLLVRTESAHIRCGILFFDRDEARRHLAQNPGHRLKSTRWVPRWRAKL